MNTVNASTGFSPFQLQPSMSLHVMPLLVLSPSTGDTTAMEVVRRMEGITAAAQDSLLHAKISQSLNSLCAHSPETLFNIGDSVYLSTSNRHHKYMHSGENCVAKFMPRFNGPYKVIAANLAHLYIRVLHITLLTSPSSCTLSLTHSIPVKIHTCGRISYTELQVCGLLVERRGKDERG